MAETSFVVVTNLVTNMILRTAYINRNIEKTSLKKGTLKTTGTSFVTIEESVGDAAYITNNVASKHRHS